jgi:hypothetical protein
MTCRARGVLLILEQRSVVGYIQPTLSIVHPSLFPIQMTIPSLITKKSARIVQMHAMPTVSVTRLDTVDAATHPVTQDAISPFFSRFTSLLHQCDVANNN